MKKLLGLICGATMAMSPAFAGIGDYIPSGLELGVGVSATSGLNGFVGYANKNFESFWWKRLGVRFDFASTSPIKSSIDSLIDSYMGNGIEVGDHLTITDGKIESQHFAAMVDFYPFGNTWFFGGWRISGGYVFGEMNVDTMLTGSDETLSALAGKRFQLGDHIWEYTGGDVHGTANAKWDFSGPYIGTGFDIGLFRGFKIFMDAGVVFTSKAAQLGLDIPYDNVAALRYSNDGGSSWQSMTIPAEYAGVVAQLQNDIDDTISEAQEEIDKYKFFPMVKLGFMYRF